MKFINSINEIINIYDNFIIDQWGVMHDGTAGYSHAIETIKLLNKNNKNLFIISNSSKRNNFTNDKLPKLGFEKDFFIEVFTSGEMIWKTLNDNYSKLQDKKICYHIFDSNKEDGLLFRKGLNLNYTNDINEADFILACTPFSKMMPVDYIPILNKAIDKNLVMYCANPDYETINTKVDKTTFCMGVIADIYEKMGGKVIIRGKPEIAIYYETTKSIKLDKTKTVAIGDSMLHDIKGANNFNIDSVLVKSGIHKDILKIKKISKNHHIYPTYIIDDFCI